jgi:hypothetical protein
MKPILLIVLIVLLSLLITSCAHPPSDAVTESTYDVSCAYLVTNTRLCAVYLDDDTLCMVVIYASQGGVGITCDWE